MKFLLKNVALPEGGGKISAKIAEIFYAAFYSDFAVKNFKSPKNRISAIFAGISDPPPLWKSQNFENKFHFRGRSTSDFSLNWEEFLNFDTLSGLFRKATFLNFPSLFFPNFA